MTDRTFAHRNAVNRYGFYCIPDEFETREVSKILMKGQVNEPRTLDLMRRLVGTGDIISGGAFIGDFLPPLSQALVDGALVHSFEPNPLAFEAAGQVLELNRLANVKLHPVAVGEQESVLPLRIAKPDGRALGGMSMIVGTHVEGQTIEVPVKRLDDLIDPDRQVTILQLDIEGHEWPALLGAQRIIETNRPVIIVETLPESAVQVSEKRLAEVFPDAGYRFMGIMERNSFFVPTPRD